MILHFLSNLFWRKHWFSHSSTKVLPYCIHYHYKLKHLQWLDNTYACIVIWLNPKETDQFFPRNFQFVEPTFRISVFIVQDTTLECQNTYSFHLLAMNCALMYIIMLHAYSSSFNTRFILNRHVIVVMWS